MQLIFEEKHQQAGKFFGYLYGCFRHWSTSQETIFPMANAKN